MMTDGDVRKAMADGHISIKPDVQDDRIQPVSVDLTLASEILEIGSLENDSRRYVVTKDGLHLPANTFVLASTVENVKLAPHIAAHVHGKSTLGRRGLFVHVTAGLIDPGWNGQITLEMYCVNPCGILLVPGMKICQITFEDLGKPVLRPYGSKGLNSHYQGQVGPTKPRT